jgi:putative transposase
MKIGFSALLSPLALAGSRLSPHANLAIFFAKSLLVEDSVPRSPRHVLWNEAACYHVMNRGQNRATLFSDDKDFAYFCGLLARYGQRFDLRLYHYCLLNNHFHLLLQLPQPHQLSRVMAGLLVAYVRYVQRRHHFVGHVFQGRFKSPAVEAETYLLSCGRYIVERNPLAAGLTTAPWAYRCGPVAGPMPSAKPTPCWRPTLGMSSCLRSRAVGKRCGRSSCSARIPRIRSSNRASGSSAAKISAAAYNGRQAAPCPAPLADLLDKNAPWDRFVCNIE